MSRPWDAHDAWLATELKAVIAQVRRETKHATNCEIEYHPPTHGCTCNLGDRGDAEVAQLWAKSLKIAVEASWQDEPWQRLAIKSLRTQE